MKLSTVVEIGDAVLEKHMDTVAMSFLAMYADLADTARKAGILIVHDDGKMSDAWSVLEGYVRSFAMDSIHGAMGAAVLAGLLPEEELEALVEELLVEALGDDLSIPEHLHA